MLRSALNQLLFFPDRRFLQTPADVGLAHEELHIDTEDGERLHAWWIAAPAPAIGHILLSHGNGGNIGDRVLHASLLTAAGFDVLSYDYRGYGASTGRPSEDGTYRDARAAAGVLRERAPADRIVYLGESLGGGVSVALAVESPPAGLVLQSTFTSVRDIARRHYPFIPAAAVPDAYPSIRRIPDLEAPLLSLHGDQDDIVPLMYGEALFDAAPEPKEMHVYRGAGHNDLVTLAGRDYGERIAAWFTKVTRSHSSDR